MRAPSAMLLVAIAAALWPAAVARAQFGLGGDRAVSAEDVVQVRLLADVDRIPPGATFHLVLVFDIDPQWHIYWKNPGVSGLPPDVEITAPDGFTVGLPRFTRPKAIQGPDGLNYGYEGRAAMFLPVTAPAGASSSAAATFNAAVSYLVCKRACLLGRAEASLALDMATEPGLVRSVDPIVAAQRDRLPRLVSETPDASLAFDGAVLRVSGPAEGATTATFFPVLRPGIRFGEAEIEIAGGRFELRVPVEVRPADALGEPLRLEGLVALGMKQDEPSYEFDEPLATSPR